MHFRNFKFYSKSYTTTSTSTANAHVNTVAHAINGQSAVSTVANVVASAACAAASAAANAVSYNSLNTHNDDKRKEHYYKQDLSSEFFETSYVATEEQNLENVVTFFRKPTPGSNSHGNNSSSNGFINFSSNLNPNSRSSNKYRNRGNGRFRQRSRRCNNSGNYFKSNTQFETIRNEKESFNYDFTDNYNYKFKNKTTNSFGNNSTYNNNNNQIDCDGLNTLGANISYINIDQQLDINSYNYMKLQRRNSVDFICDSSNTSNGTRLSRSISTSIYENANKTTLRARNSNNATTSNYATNLNLGMKTKDSKSNNTNDFNDNENMNTTMIKRTRSKSINTGSIALNNRKYLQQIYNFSSFNHTGMFTVEDMALSQTNAFVTKRYLSTDVHSTRDLNVEEFQHSEQSVLKTEHNKKILTNELNSKGDDELPNSKTQSAQNNVIRETSNPWPVDTEESLNKETFLQQNMKEIDLCFENEDYNKINSLYMALKRNDIFPPLETFEKIIASLCLRDLDSKNLDERMFNLLNCYQDLINSKKFHPSNLIYDNVIATLLEGSILAKKIGNYNGLDFFKIAIELFKTVEKQSLQKPSEKLLNNLMVSINLYPHGYVSLKDFNSKIAAMCSNKNHLYYIATLKYNQDPDIIESLIKEYRQKSFDNNDSNKYKVLSVAIESLIRSNNLVKASKILDESIMEIKNSNGQSKDIHILLTKYLISLSGTKDHYKKAYKMWYKFSKLTWIPAFSYDFYLQFLSNILNNNDWDLACKLYFYMYTANFPNKNLKDSDHIKVEASMKSDVAFNPDNVDSQVELLLNPSNIDYIHSHFLNIALNNNSKKVILTILEESMLKNYKFDLPLYNKIFEHLKNYQKKSQDDYLLRFIDAHGQMFESASNFEKFEFLNSIVNNYKNQVLLNRVAQLSFFKDICKNFKSNYNFNYSGLICVFQNIWNSPQSILSSSSNLELHAFIVSEFHNLDYQFENLSNVNDKNKVFQEFKVNVTAKFKRLMINYKRLNLDSTVLSDRVVHLATRVLDIPEINADDYIIPGDWDKTYPVHLGSKLRKSTKQGLKDYQILKQKGYCFDWDTYYTLMTKNCIDMDIISNLISLSPSEEKLNAALNILISINNPKNLGKYVFENSQFISVILPRLNDASLLKITKNVLKISDFISKIDFAVTFKPIKQQVKYEKFIKNIYMKLFDQQDYTQVLELNQHVPVLDLSMLLKSYLRVGDYVQFETFFTKWSSKMAQNEVNNVKAEYLVNMKKYDAALAALNSSEQPTPHKTNDLRTFVMFVKDCLSNKQTVHKIDRPIENTLQLANVLCLCGSKQEMALVMNDFLETHTSIKNRDLIAMTPYQVKFEVLDQILNNLMSVLKLEPDSELVGQAVFKKLTNFFQFKGFLFGNSIEPEQLVKILDIWNDVSPQSLDFAFNNLAETIYYDKNCPFVTLNDYCTFDIQDTAVSSAVFAKFIELYTENNESEKVEKVKVLEKTFLN